MKSKKLGDGLPAVRSEPEDLGKSCECDSSPSCANRKAYAHFDKPWRGILWQVRCSTVFFRFWVKKWWGGNVHAKGVVNITASNNWDWKCRTVASCVYRNAWAIIRYSLREFAVISREKRKTRSMQIELRRPYTSHLAQYWVLNRSEAWGKIWPSPYSRSGRKFCCENVCSWISGDGQLSISQIPNGKGEGE